MDFVEGRLRHVQVYFRVSMEQLVQQGVLALFAGGGVRDLDPRDALVFARYQ